MSTLDTGRRGASVDHTFRKTGLSVGVVAGTAKDKPFGHEFYRQPVGDTVFYRVALGNDNKEKRKNFADAEAKRL